MRLNLKGYCSKIRFSSIDFTISRKTTKKRFIVFACETSLKHFENILLSYWI